MTASPFRRFPCLESLEDRQLLDVAPIGPINDPESFKLYDEAYYGGINARLAAVDVSKQMRIRTAADAVSLRQELVDFIWKQDGFPDQLLPAEVAKGVASPLADSYPELPNLDRIDRLTVVMPYGVRSSVYFFHPAKSADRLLIWHQGHNDDLADAGGYRTLAEFLGRRFSVLASWMPFFGENAGQGPFQIGNCTLDPDKDGHELGCAESEKFTPLRFFLDPVVVSLNYALRETPFTDVVMAGISGGGWTTTLVAAVDPRVRVSIPVAGTLPLYLRVEPHDADLGDWEQNGSALYEQVDYLDLYVLGSYGPGRRQAQVLNKYDDCCFAGVRFRTYLDTVKDTVADLGAGEFTAFLDDSVRPGFPGDIHQVSPHALATLLTHAADDDPAQFVDDGENTYWNGGRTRRDTFRARGPWAEVRGEAFAGDTWVADPGPGNARATWQFQVTPGRYQVAVTWNPKLSPLPGVAPFGVQDDRKALAEVVVDQRDAPADFFDGQVGWHILGEFDLTSTRLLVLLTNTPESTVLADGVRITPVAERPAPAAWAPDNILSLLAAEDRSWRKFPW